MGESLAQDFFTNTLDLGYDYQSNSDAVNLINYYIGTTATVQPEKIESSFTQGEMSYKNYYWVHLIGTDGLYNAGQILDSHVTDISLQGYRSVISFRASGEATNRISTDPTTGPVDNHEFSDDQGNYDPKLERKAFLSVGIKFYNLPLSGSATWTKETFDKYYPIIENAITNEGPTLVHCASGYRSAGYAVAYSALKAGKCSSWAIQQAKKIGFSYDINSGDEAVLQFFTQVLGC